MAAVEEDDAVEPAEIVGNSDGAAVDEIEREARERITDVELVRHTLASSP